MQHGTQKLVHGSMRFIALLPFARDLLLEYHYITLFRLFVACVIWLC